MRENSSHQRHHSPASLTVVSVKVSLDFLDLLLDIGRLEVLHSLEEVGSVFVSDLGHGRLVYSPQYYTRSAGDRSLARPQLLLLPNHSEEVSSNAVSCFWPQLFFCLPFLKNNDPL